MRVISIEGVKQGRRKRGKKEEMDEGREKGINNARFFSQTLRGRSSIYDDIW